MTAHRDVRLAARFRGVRTVEIEGKRVTYAIDAAMASALTNLRAAVVRPIHWWFASVDCSWLRGASSDGTTTGHDLAHATMQTFDGVGGEIILLICVGLAKNGTPSFQARPQTDRRVLPAPLGLELGEPAVRPFRRSPRDRSHAVPAAGACDYVVAVRRSLRERRKARLYPRRGLLERQPNENADPVRVVRLLTILQRSYKRDRRCPVPKQHEGRATFIPLPTNG